MDPGVCSPIRDGGNMSDALYDRWCIDTATGNMRTTGNMRAIALADPNRSGINPFTGAPYAALYTENTMGADGVMYEAGTPIIVFRNATGTFGNTVYDPRLAGTYKPLRITGPGTFTLDAAMSKSIEFMEGKRLELRVDAANILNRAVLTGDSASSVRYFNGGRTTQPALPGNRGVNASGATAFGNMPSKTQHRTFQARLRLSF